MLIRSDSQTKAPLGVNGKRPAGSLRAPDSFLDVLRTFGHLCPHGTTHFCSLHMKLPGIPGPALVAHYDSPQPQQAEAGGVRCRLVWVPR